MNLLNGLSADLLTLDSSSMDTAAKKELSKQSQFIHPETQFTSQIASIRHSYLQIIHWHKAYIVFTTIQ